VNQLPRNKYPEETRQKIIETSLKLFVEKGYDETTVLDIVANLGGMTRGAFYHHFKNKEDILEAVFYGEEYAPKGFETAKAANVANGMERLRLALKLSLAENTGTTFQTDATKLAMQLMMSPRFLAEKVKGDIQTAALLEPLIAEGMADGSIAPGNPKLLAQLFMVVVNFWMMPTIFPTESEDELWQKGEMMLKIMEAVNFPVIDDELTALFEQTVETVLMPKETE